MKHPYKPGRALTGQAASLRDHRKRYKWRVVRNHSLEPRPERLGAHFGPVAKVSGRVDDEWFFETRGQAEAFAEKFGGVFVAGASKKRKQSEQRASNYDAVMGAARSAMVNRKQTITLAGASILAGLDRVKQVLDERLSTRKAR